MTTAAERVAAGVLLALLGGYGDGTSSASTGRDAGSSGAATSSTSITPGTSTTTTGPATSSTSTTLPGTSSSSGDPGLDPNIPPGFLIPPDAPGSRECNIWTENCPPGQKCMPYANDGGAAWNATMCVPLADDPRGVGEPCTVIPVSDPELDECETHAMCWDSASDTNQGTCIAMCVGSEASHVCPEPGTQCSFGGEGIPILCIPTCDPLLDDCPDPQRCYSNFGGFFCGGWDEPAMDLGATCSSSLECDPGVDCREAPGYCDEQSAPCCVAWCDQTTPDCPDGLECTPLEDPTSIPVGFDHLGLCLPSL